MRHNKKINHLGRTNSHREAMLSNMASSLILHKRIFTTTAKAKSLRKYVEPLITKSRENTTHSRRTVFSSLQDKEAVKELFNTVSEKVGDRPGGYTRILKTGYRLGDNAAMCFIELVDFNENMLKDTKKATSKTRRSRSKTSGAKAVAAATAEAPAKKTKDVEAAEKPAEAPTEKPEEI
ncbi:MAG: 50S ribosomal protein L17, partial [Tannerella sp.]|nr:50S ribosomal protein L17 [Tannerella sp.]